MMSNLAFFLLLFLCCPNAQNKIKCVNQNICNCNTFLGEMVHFLEKFQGCQGVFTCEPGMILVFDIVHSGKS